MSGLKKKKNLWYIYTMEYYAAERKKELRPFMTTWMKLESSIHYAQWSKPGGERQIPYDLTYKWNLINKQASKIQPETLK